MAHLNPCLECIMVIKSQLEMGVSTRQATQKYISLKVHDEFARSVGRFLYCLEQGVSTEALRQSVRSPHRRALLQLLKAGLDGQSIHERLQELELEVVFACELELQKFVDTLPFQAMVPLLFFQFPAFLLLLFGPILNEFIRSLNS